MDGNEEQYSNGASAGQGNQEDLSSLLNPQSLAEAFRTIRVVEQELDSGTMGGAGSYGQPEPAASYDPEPEGDYEAGESGLGDDGGYEAGDDPYAAIDWEEIEKQTRSEIDQAAMMQAVNFFKQQNIRKFTLEDLYERMDDGTVEFVNPDKTTEHRKAYFQSRDEARGWINDVNSEIERKLKETARNNRTKMLQEQKPKLELIKWGPTYAGLNQTEREIVDELIEPYEVLDDKGEAIGYSCDLNKMTNQARKLAARFAEQQEQAAKQSKSNPQPQQQTPVRRPTSEIGSRGSNGVLDEDEVPEINSLSDAIKYYEKQQAKRKKN